MDKMYAMPAIYEMKSSVIELHESLMRPVSLAGESLRGVCTIEPLFKMTSMPTFNIYPKNSQSDRWSGDWSGFSSETEFEENSRIPIFAREPLDDATVEKVPNAIDSKERPARKVKKSPLVLLKQEVKLYDFFISYSWGNQIFARRLVAELRGLGYKVWFAERSIDKGDPIPSEIDEGLKQSRYFVPIFSKNYMNAKGGYRGTYWTTYELNTALVMHKKGRISLLPIWYKVNEDNMLDYRPGLASYSAIVMKPNCKLEKLVLELHFELAKRGINPRN
jgi:TIR domain